MLCLRLAFDAVVEISGYSKLLKGSGGTCWHWQCTISILVVFRCFMFFWFSFSNAPSMVRSLSFQVGLPAFYYELANAKLGTSPQFGAWQSALRSSDIGIDFSENCLLQVSMFGRHLRRRGWRDCNKPGAQNKIRGAQFQFSSRRMWEIMKVPNPGGLPLAWVLADLEVPRKRRKI